MTALIVECDPDVSELAGRGSGEATVRMESLPEGDGLYVAMLEVATVVLLSERLSPEARGEFCEALRAAALRAREGL